MNVAESCDLHIDQFIYRPSFLVYKVVIGIELARLVMEPSRDFIRLSLERSPGAA